MSVYVDPLFDHGGSATFPWKRSCHMYADTLDELHAMARAIGMKRAWFQNKERLPRYDLVPARRAAAVSAGAVEHTREEVVRFMRANSPAVASLFSPERRAEILADVLIDGGKPTDGDLVQISMFKQSLSVAAEAESFGLSRDEARSRACLEVYGDRFGEGAGLRVSKEVTG